MNVGIVGAGLAGLRCADVLLQHGCKVTIFEARNRIGGRVAQSQHLGHLVDLGPNWIHGSVDNAIFDIAKATKTRLFDWDEVQAIFDTDGKLVDPEEAAEYSRILWDEDYFTDAFQYSREHQDSIDANKSLYDFLVEKSQRLFTDESPTVAKAKRDLFLLTAEAWGAYVGSSVKRQSLKFFWMEQCLQGETPFVANTYRSILDYVARRAKEGADIRLEHEVNRIVSAAENTRSSPRPSIACSNGVQESFDAVVVTTPLGWLKNNEAVFEPPLPPVLSRAIHSIGYGALDKVYVTFPHAFWDVPLKDHGPVKTVSKTEGQERHGETKYSEPNTTQVDAAESPSVSLFLAPKYAPDTNPDCLHQECMNLSVLPDDCAQPTLLFYIYGETSRHVADLATSASNKDEADTRVIDFVRPYYSLLPNYDANDPSCKPKAVLATAWAADQWAGYGSYSNFQIGLEHGDQDMETIRHGLPERRVYLAGEHTAPIVATGTTTGAYMSGQAVAKRILASRAVF